MAEKNRYVNGKNRLSLVMKVARAKQPFVEPLLPWNIHLVILTEKSIDYDLIPLRR